MIRAIDKRITALFQALVNASQKRPQWWGEQCSYLLLLNAGFYAMDSNWPGPMWVRVMLCAATTLLAGLMWLESRVDVMWHAQQDLGSTFWRMLFAAGLCWDVASLLMGSPNLKAMMLSASFTAYFYFLTCEDPPPPRRRTAPKLSTQGAP